MSAPTAHLTRPAFATRAVAALSVFSLALHVLVDVFSPYGFQRDEFLYMAMGRHLRLWRMDFPPFIAMLSQVERALLGDSMVAIRLGSSISAGLLVLLAALIARELGGRKFAQILAAITVAFSPLFLRTGVLFQPVVFDQLWWTLALYALVRLCAGAQRDDLLDTAPKWWIALGVTCGVGLLTKFSLLFFGAALVAAIVIAPQRRVLLTPWPWLAAVIAFVIGTPSITGQLALGYPVVDQMKTLQGSQLAHVSLWSFVQGQLHWGPGLLLGLTGALTLVSSRSMRQFRAVGWTCIGAFMLLLVLHGKSYYIGPIYPTLFAAGAVAFERWLASRTGAGVMVARVASIVILIAYACVALPVELPIFSKEATAAFVSGSGVTSAARTNQGELLRLPQDYADMLGWPQLVNAVAHVYDSLPPEKREQVVLVGENYGEAGAMEFYGPKLRLPRVVSAAGSYWFFGPGEKPGTVVISLGVTQHDLEQFFGTVTYAGKVLNDWGVPEERDVSIYVGENPKETLQQVWPKLAGRN